MNIAVTGAMRPNPLPRGLDDLLSEACRIRDAHWGRAVTYSRKVFVPLTNMCRDTCGYCTFVKHPSSPEARIMTPEQVLASARRGEREGCKELLFSLGEKPELRYEAARDGLARLGYARMTDYLRDMCALVLAETSLLPHVNAGTLADDEIEALRPVSASMGMMLETISRRLTRRGMAHHACPDKVPVQRLRTLERAGLRRVPFTTGLLIGIGETWEERIAALHAIEASHRRHGHIQEVIIQNFQRKPDIEMADHPEPELEDMLRTIAAARIILSPEISLQAPPNLSSRHIAYLGAGINDWGGISPVTIDFINPQHEWPEIRALAASCKTAGFALRERLTVYPRYLLDGGDYLDPAMLSRVSAMAGAGGLARAQHHIGETP
ncbi:7,8-didemethyl-8-hydroxy-5-deazariboflavin synthase CofG [Paracoccus denitrificans]|jgi:FO synthase|uniref:7,8-didemethyl-8-hydroxy-5-deazariboflavin synthase n=1 Tax=Paracoccus denitrificans (strain Pd 1222) TaxID=318586 RepID=A1B128_PARDP|nr:7,8-didemethyl-8-hydroxy-5-deazariboflavin synthase CofG [Paracoccus denitrificans]ABL69222.1 FO synthase subunit 1 [Paracoccus denitrificans PD1222]MBB4629126.1 FO synthase [Paracoccus denitrificans]MCU7431065.1 7,8-didemethyl-8-hydroxy-5-deazariboflavin synthase CofG [Paracoccus denitrificans]QAR27233.1 7,8-didemethyl-8-hydroxy-5-deazariboflavin synthase subunit CofG [Paracoccus denitrificans]UFS64598.1 7,8-didemethyl-8-hydroxy-5-deazariboflavin synthase CofG [Paracoccus denitrificans]